MLTRIQARVVEFFKRPEVQSSIRHCVTAVAGAALAFVAVHGVAGVASAGGLALLVRFVWAKSRPVLVQEAENVASDAVPYTPQTDAAAS